MTVTDELLRNNAAYASAFDESGLRRDPAKRLAVVTCNLSGCRRPSYLSNGTHCYTICTERCSADARLIAPSRRPCQSTWTRAASVNRT